MASLQRAIEIAVEAHKGQTDKAGMPYILHPLRLMFQMKTDNEKIAAVLHDVVEDSDWALDDLKKEKFNNEVIEAVNLLTRDDNDSYELTKTLFPSLNSYKLVNILVKLDLEGNASHNAIDDVMATVSLVLHLNKQNNETLNDRIMFLKLNYKKIKKFQQEITPFWNKINSNFRNNDYSIYEFIDDFINYLDKELDRSEKSAIIKLVRFIKSECEKNISLHEYLKENLVILSKLKEVDLIIREEKVIISTIHRAKGLEWETVIIPSCTDDYFPGYYAKRDANRMPDKGEEIIKEEARKLYVAMTRAKKRLILTQNTQSRNQYGKCFPQSVSRFLQPVMIHFTRK